MADADVTDVVVRECVSIEDFQQCIELERAVWHDNDLGIMPIRLYMISKACNAPTIGAFDAAGRLVGFVHTSLALIEGHVAYHSHLAAVLEGLRHRDIGFRMKLAQRERALQLGIPLIIWTFDPLQSRNAYLNINKLGAVIRRYEVNYYSEGISAVFDSNVPSDRIFAEWWVASPHVEAVLAGNRPLVDEGLPAVEIPDDINAIRSASIDEHLRWRLEVREAFERVRAGGTIVRGFSWEPERKRSRYLFGPDEEQFHFEIYDRAGLSRSTLTPSGPSQEAK
jgi:predicted GNAT superfamily acetyltransferase